MRAVPINRTCPGSTMRYSGQVMTQQKSPSEASTRPVIYLHAKGRAKAGPEDIEALLGLGCTVCSHLAAEGTVRTAHGFDQPGALLGELAERFPGRPIGFIRAGLRPTGQQLAELTAILERADEPLVLTALSNANTALNPFAGLTAPEEPGDDEPGELVGLLAPGYLHALSHWTDHFAILSSATAERMAEAAGNTLMNRLESVKGRLAVPDYLFVHDPGIDTYEQSELQPHESPYPPPFGDLSARLQQWMDSGIRQLPLPGAAEQPATLHITHSWGGGIAHWIDTFILADREHVHFQLRAEGPQSDQGCGQKLSLYAGNELRCAIASWWLRPPIRSVEDHVSDYQRIFEHLCRRYRIGRVIVSSLIGHSLDALRSGLPTLQVLHDHFPLWPLLSVNPHPYLRDQRPVDLETALAEETGQREFEDKDAAAWSGMRKAYVQALADYHVTIVAPGRSVLELQSRLEPAFEPQSAHVIPHGSPVPDTGQTVAPRPRSDGRLRMVVLGRIQAGKGRQLLLDSLDDLTEHVQVYLLGSGKSGEEFFGRTGVDVILEYRQDELPALLDAIGPHFAALLSIVPETFSFTLSELQRLGIPAIATRVGSFPDRIADGETGWLIDPHPRALVDRVAGLCGAIAEIEKVRSNLPGVEVATPEAMLSAYNSVFPVPAGPVAIYPAEADDRQTQVAASQHEALLAAQELQRAAEAQEALRRELDERTEWALDTNRQLKREQQVRADVENALATMRASLSELQARYQELAARNAELAARNVQLAAQNKHQEEQIATVLSSKTWRFTKPFRVAHRLVGRFALARAWNPLRWPGLASDFAEDVSRLGIKGALRGLQDATGSQADAGRKEPGQEEAARTAGTPEPPKAFPSIEQPDVSIVIPVYNKWPLTAACLSSLAETAGGLTFEVIVVDDGSDDETQESLAAIEGLIYIRNDRNLGFVGSCNRGARRARGEYLVMLNNDTRVLEGWLDELVGTLKRRPDAGLVGARLVYPDGRLQESGGLIFSDGSGWNYGREDDAGKPDYNFMREVDYCSGACIAMRTELFVQLGGFDERYAPAYYEDTDLAFRVREAGLKVLVQPASTVIHHEGATSGTDTSAGVKRYQPVNQKKFVERWREQLRLQPDSVDDKRDHAALRAASEHRIGGRILFIAAPPPDSSQDKADELPARLMNCCIDLGYGVTWLAHGSSPARSCTHRLQAAGIEVLDGPWVSSLPDFFAGRGPRFDYVFVCGHELLADYLALINDHCPNSRLILDAVECDYPRAVARAEDEPLTAQQRSALWSRHLALSAIDVADVVLLGNEADKERLAKDFPGKRAHVLGHRDRSETAEDRTADDCESLAALFALFS